MTHAASFQTVTLVDTSSCPQHLFTEDESLRLRVSAVWVVAWSRAVIPHCSSRLASSLASSSMIKLVMVLALFWQVLFLSELLLFVAPGLLCNVCAHGSRHISSLLSCYQYNHCEQRAAQSSASDDYCRMWRCLITSFPCSASAIGLPAWFELLAYQLHEGLRGACATKKPQFDPKLHCNW